MKSNESFEHITTYIFGLDYHGNNFSNIKL